MEVTQEDRHHHQFPDGGKWFRTQSGALHLFNTAKNPGFVVAWDKVGAESKGGKVYGYYRSIEDFHEALVHESGPVERCAYELIPENTPCRLYLDVEWEGIEDYEHSCIRWILEEISKRAEAVLGKSNVTFFVACATRCITSPASTPMYKNSYHVVCPDLVFRCNHNGEMLAFIRDTVHADPSQHHQWYVGDKCVIDLKVYTKNRCFRTITSTKRGYNSPFRMLNLNDDTLSDNPNILIDFVSMRVTYPEVRLFDVVKYQVQPQEAAAGSSASKRPREGEAGPSSASKRPHENVTRPALPFPLPLIKDILVSYGDTVSQVYLSGFEQDTTTWKIQGFHQGKSSRPCLASKGTTHSKNNCILFVKQIGNQRFLVQYVCMGGKCKSHRTGGGVVELAQVKMDPQTSTWSFDKITDESGSDSESENTSEVEDEMSTEPEANTYEMVKAEFEKYNSKVEIPFVYLRVDEDNPTEFSLYDRCKFSDFHSAVKCWVPSKKSDESGLIQKDFMKLWFKDENKKTYKKIVMDPLSNDPKYFNLWRGYLCDQLKDEGLDPVDASAPVIEHIFQVITSENQGYADWVLDWMANIVQRPWKKTNVAIVLFGKQGCGKNIIFDWFREKVLGLEHTFQVHAFFYFFVALAWLF